MSFSITSTNSGDFSSDDCEINDDELSIVKEGDIVKTNGEQFTDQQQLKEMSEKFAKMQLVLKNTKLELKNKGLQDKLKQQEMNALLAKIEAENGKMKNEIEKMHAKMDEKEKQQLEKKEKQLEKKVEQYMEKLEELQKNQKALHEEYEKKLMEQIVNLQTKVDKLEMGVSTEQIEHFQNEQKRKMNALEKEQKLNHMKLALLNFRQNYWNVNACHNDLQITELTVHCHKRGESDGFRNIFATHPILLDEDSPGIFYFEISVKNMQHYPFGRLTFGFAAKKWTKLEGTIAPNFGTYAYSNDGYITGCHFSSSKNWKTPESGKSILPELLLEMDKFRAKIEQRKQERFYGADLAMEKVGESTREVLEEQFQSFYTSVLAYLDKWHRIDRFPEKLEWVALVSRKIPHDDALSLARQIAPELTNDLFDDKWKKLFEANLPNLLKLVSIVLSVPVSNAFVERVFSLCGSQWTDTRNLLQVETVKALVQTKANFDLSCPQMYQMLISNHKLLEKIGGWEKYF
ncbi:hypothetical protein niasHS_015683 [Heterodera schachtii]|uniref:HAT C-terminal dimerisation domain-containing protein n=1 Tax=Heterodera schachtii TaxID=97005 RepID=A0ABD2HSA7_HETSC